jgi:hypothetical protein
LARRSSLSLTSAEKTKLFRWTLMDPRIRLAMAIPTDCDTLKALSVLHCTS